MSVAPEVRRSDKLMPEEGARELLARGYAGRLATVGADGFPYVVPLLYVWMGGEVWVHNTSAEGHLRRNIDHESRVCFEVDEPGEVFPYGRFDCDTSVAYRSVIAFGRARIVEQPPLKKAFFDAFMQKYAGSISGRPKGAYPRLHLVTVYAISVERMTGKETPVPAPEDRWPRVDRTKTPNAG